MHLFFFNCGWFSSKKDPVKNAKVELNWVYGHQTENTAQKIVFYQSPVDTGKFEESLLYYISKIVVIYLLKIHAQKHYLAHENEISCITESKKGWCATGEVADFPSIHIWDIESQKTVSVLRGIHRGSIFLLSFICNDQYLVSTGERLSTPVIVYSMKDNSVVLSTYFQDPLLSIINCNSLLPPPLPVKPAKQLNKLSLKKPPAPSVTDSDSVFIFSSPFAMHIFEVNSNSDFQTTTVDVREQDEFEVSPITCMQASWVGIEKEASAGKGASSDKAIRILSGHLNGQVIIWMGIPLTPKKEKNGFLNFQTNFERCLVTTSAFKHQVIRVLQHEKNTIIVTDDGFLNYWDPLLKENFKKVNLTKLPNRELSSLHMSDMIVAKNKLILTSADGDVFEIELETKKEWSKNTFAYTIKERKLKSFLKLPSQTTCMALVEKDGNGFIYVASESSRVYCISKEGHEVVDSWHMEEPVTAMDAVSFPEGGIAFAFGTANGRIQLQIDWEEKLRHKSIDHRINDIKFTGDATYLAVAAEDKFIYIFTYSSSSFFSSNPKKVEFEKEIPITLNFLDDFRTLVVGTNIGSHFIMDVPDLKSMSQLLESERLDISVFKGKFPTESKKFKEKTQLPFVMGQEMKFITGSDEHGSILFWKDKEELMNNSGSILLGHNSTLSSIAVSKSQENFYTLGLNDNLLMEWNVQVDEAYAGEEEEETIKGSPEKPEEVNVMDDIILRELNFSVLTFEMKRKVSDSSCLFRGTNSQMLGMLSQTKYPKIDETHLLQKRAPPLIVELELVFGFHAYTSRKTLGYVHYFSPYKAKKKGLKLIDNSGNGNEEANQPLGLTSAKKAANALLKAQQEYKNVLIPGELKKEMLFATESLQPYLPKHQSCDRGLVYFVSRIVVIYDPLQSKQKFYQSHQAKITCIATHPTKNIVASAECCLGGPIVHVWSIYTLEPIRKLQTSHSNGVLVMSFSKDGIHLVTIASDKVFSIEVFDWYNEVSKVFQNTGYPPILDVQFNPHNPMQIATGGYNHVALWEIKGTSLVRADMVHLNEDEKDYTPFVTTLAYGSYLLGDEITTDIIVGTNFGDIGVVTAGFFSPVKKKAHEKMINIVQVVDLYKDKTLIVSAGEDEKIKIWSFNFVLVSEFNIRHCELFPPKTTANLSAQSIDFYACRSSRPIPWAGTEEREDINPLMLVGTRNGDIFEVKFNRTITGSTRVRLKKKEAEEEEKDDSSSSSNSSRRQRGQTLSNNDDFSKSAEIQSGSNIGESVYSDDVSEEKGSRRGSEAIRDHEKDSERDLKGSKKPGTNQNEGKKREEEEELEEEYDERITFLTQPVLQNHCVQHSTDPSNIFTFFAQKKIKISMHPRENLLVSVGGKEMILWNLDGNQYPITRKQLENLATCVSFSPDGKLVVVGFAEGLIGVFEFNYSSRIEEEEEEAEEKAKLSPFEVKTFLKHKESKHSAISIQFSPSGNLIAVSFNSIQVPEPPEKDSEGFFEKNSSFITIYIRGNSKKVYGKHQFGDIKHPFVKLLDIKQSGIREFASRPKNQLQNGGLAATLLFFSKDEDYLLAYFQPVDTFQTKDHKSTSDTAFILWNLQADQQVNGFESIKGLTFPNLVFPNQINGEYSQLTLFEKDNFKDKIQKSLSISTMEFIEGSDAVLFGNTYGDIHIARSSCLLPFKNASDKIQLDHFVRSKTYSAHASNVSQIVLSPNKEFFITTGEHDEAFFKFSIKQEKTSWEIDYMEFSQKSEDLFFKETDLKEEHLPARQEIIDDRRLVEENLKQEISLSLTKIINRKGFTRRNNLFMAKDHRLIYSIGSQVVILDTESSMTIGQPIFQEFLSPESYTDMTSFPEVSCLIVAPNELFLAIGTTQLTAKVIIWELTSKTFLKETVLYDAISVQSIAFAFDSRHMVAVGLHKNGSQVVYFLDGETSEVQSAMKLTYSLPFKIKYVEFVPNSINSFVTCGIQHIAIWNYSGSYLSYQSLPIENPKDLREKEGLIAVSNQGGKFDGFAAIGLEDERGMEENEEYENRMLKCAFLGILFIQRTMVTVGHDGMIYIWRDQKITKKQNAHSHCPIFALAKSKTHPFRFATGGADGRVIIWDLRHSISTDSFILEQIFVYSLSDEGSNTNQELHVQSLVYGKDNTLFAGTKSGSIFKFQLFSTLNDYKTSRKSSKELMSTVLFSDDSHIIKEVGISLDNSRIYSITGMGLFSIYDFESLRKIFSINYNKPSLNLVVCKQKPFVILVFETEILVYNVENEEEIQPISSFSLQMLTAISYMDVSVDESTMAIAMATHSENNARIDIYQINFEHLQFKLLSTIPNISSSIEFIDFSTDNCYLLFRDNIGMPMYYDLINQSKTDIINLESSIEWVSEGLKVNGKTRILEDIYREGNKVLKIKKLSETSIVVTDDNGTVSQVLMGFGQNGVL